MLHDWAFVIAGAQWNIEPDHFDLCPVAKHFCHGGWRIKWGLRQRRLIGIINLQTIDIAVDIHLRSFDPTRMTSTDGLYIKPLRVFASPDDFEITSCNQTSEI